MEVHAHTHTERKKWTNYFWEFLMLFLAVFCGFLAENQREHMIEHQREKKYAQTFYEDLKIDTTLLNAAIKERKFVLPKIDTFRLLVQKKPLMKYQPVPGHILEGLEQDIQLFHFRTPLCNNC